MFKYFKSSNASVKCSFERAGNNVSSNGNPMVYMASRFQGYIIACNVKR